MERHLQELAAGIERWRAKGIGDYWIRVDYIGSALNRMGIHTLTYAQGQLWHQWHEDWREIKNGADFWLFSVPGAFAWARDMLTKVLPAAGVGDEAIDLRFNQEYGYVEYMRVTAARRDASNFTFEVKEFGVGVHPDFDR
jgi:hypothetical protein